MKHPIVPVALFVALFILVGELGFGWFSRLCNPARDDAHYSHYVGSDNYLLVRVRTLPSQREKSVRVEAETMEIEDSDGTMHPCEGKVLLYLQKDSLSCSVRSGDLLLVKARLRQPDSNENPHQFDYRAFLQRRGILHTAYLSSTHYRLVGHERGGLRERIEGLREQLIEVIHYSSLSHSQQGIAEAIFLGYDDEVEDETEMHFRKAGITHLLCVSGLHVGLVAWLLGAVLFFLSNRRRERFIKGVLQLTGIWFFVLLSGMAPSAMRAGLMFSLIVVGKMFFTRPPILNSIATSALILLVANPLVLFEVGFQLSYAAVTGIVLFTPALERLIPLSERCLRWPKPLPWLLHKLCALFCVSLSAQFITTPLILFYFHQFYPYFLVANMLIIPFAGVLLGSVIVLVLFAGWPWLFALLGKMVSWELGTAEWVTTAVSEWPHAMIESIYFDTPMFLLTLVIVLALSYALIKRRWSGMTAALCVGIALMLYAQHVEARCAEQRHIDFYRVGNHTALEFFVGHESYLIADSTVANNPSLIDFQTSDNLVWRQAKRTHVLCLEDRYRDEHLMLERRFISFGGKTILIVDRSNYHYRPKEPLPVDYLLVRESPYITVQELKERYSFDTLLISSQNSVRRRTAWIAACDSVGIAWR